MKRYQTSWKDDKLNNGRWHLGIKISAHNEDEALQLAINQYIEPGREDEQAVKVKLIERKP